MKIREALKLKNLTKIGDKLMSKNNIQVLDCNKNNKLHLNGYKSLCKATKTKRVFIKDIHYN